MRKKRNFTIQKPNYWESLKPLVELQFWELSHKQWNRLAEIEKASEKDVHEEKKKRNFSMVHSISDLSSTTSNESP